MENEKKKTQGKTTYTISFDGMHMFEVSKELQEAYIAFCKANKIKY